MIALILQLWRNSRLFRGDLSHHNCKIDMVLASRLPELGQIHRYAVQIGLIVYCDTACG
jgi:hypothetical protein